MDKITQSIAPTMTFQAEKRIVVLDGWRGVAILMVVVSHACQRTHLNTMVFGNLGFLGVDIFFVLSGFLITRSLLLEQERTGSLNLREFYRRRAARILPTAFTFLVLLAVLSKLMNLGDMNLQGFISSALFFRNYWASQHTLSSIYTGHFWSLSIEEQFYCFWPVMLLFAGNRKVIWFAALLAAGCASWRFYSMIHYSGTSWKFQTLRTEYRLDGLLVGCILALLLARSNIRAFIYRNFPKEVPLFCALLVLLIYQHNQGYPTLVSYLLIALAISSTLHVEEGLAYRWLTYRCLVWTGTISFSLYVWQALFLESPFADSPFGLLGSFPFNIIAAFLIASASYYFLERPIIQWNRALFVKKRNSNHSSGTIRFGH
jgi:peptidoglycan/LPS O-acetylase OafA/YrhL